MRTAPLLFLTLLGLAEAFPTVDPETVESYIEAAEAKGRRLFIAFGDPEDFQGSFKRLTENFRSVIEDKNDPTLRFLVCSGPIPTSLVNRFFLHYYTLPKIKMFWPGGHVTYNGGTSPAHIRAWVVKQLRTA